MKPQPPGKNNEPQPAATDALLREEIQKEAYKVWLAQGCRHGEDLRHWLQAEKEVLSRLAKG